MTEESNIVLRGTKSANIIQRISELYHTTIDNALDIYYTSETARMIEDGVADLHCRSERYLAILIWEEHQQRVSKTN